MKLNLSDVFKSLLNENDDSNADKNAIIVKKTIVSSGSRSGDDFKSYSIVSTNKDYNDRVSEINKIKNELLKNKDVGALGIEGTSVSRLKQKINQIKAAKSSSQNNNLRFDYSDSDNPFEDYVNKLLDDSVLVDNKDDKLVNDETFKEQVKDVFANSINLLVNNDNKKTSRVYFEKKPTTKNLNKQIGYNIKVGAEPGKKKLRGGRNKSFTDVNSLLGLEYSFNRLMTVYNYLRSKNNDIFISMSETIYDIFFDNMFSELYVDNKLHVASKELSNYLDELKNVKASEIKELDDKILKGIVYITSDVNVPSKGINVGDKIIVSSKYNLDDKEHKYEVKTLENELRSLSKFLSNDSIPSEAEVLPVIDLIVRVFNYRSNELSFNNTDSEENEFYISGSEFNKFNEYNGVSLEYQLKDKTRDLILSKYPEFKEKLNGLRAINFRFNDITVTTNDSKTNKPEKAISLLLTTGTEENNLGVDNMIKILTGILDSYYGTSYKNVIPKILNNLNADSSLTDSFNGLVFNFDKTFDKILEDSGDRIANDKSTFISNPNFYDALTGKISLEQYYSENNKNDKIAMDLFANNESINRALIKNNLNTVHKYTLRNYKVALSQINPNYEHLKNIKFLAPLSFYNSVTRTIDGENYVLKLDDEDATSLGLEISAPNDSDIYNEILTDDNISEIKRELKNLKYDVSKLKKEDIFNLIGSTKYQDILISKKNKFLNSNKGNKEGFKNILLYPDTAFMFVKEDSKDITEEDILKDKKGNIIKGLTEYLGKNLSLKDINLKKYSSNSQFKDLKTTISFDKKVVDSSPLTKLKTKSDSKLKNYINKDLDSDLAVISNNVTGIFRNSFNKIKDMLTFKLRLGRDYNGDKLFDKMPKELDELRVELTDESNLGKINDELKQRIILLAKNKIISLFDISGKTKMNNNTLRDRFLNIFLEDAAFNLANSFLYNVSYNVRGKLKLQNYLPNEDNISNINRASIKGSNEITTSIDNYRDLLIAINDITKDKEYINNIPNELSKKLTGLSLSELVEYKGDIRNLNANIIDFESLKKDVILTYNKYVSDSLVKNLNYNTNTGNFINDKIDNVNKLTNIISKTYGLNPLIKNKLLKPILLNYSDTIFGDNKTINEREFMGKLMKFIKENESIDKVSILSLIQGISMVFNNIVDSDNDKLTDYYYRYFSKNEFVTAIISSTELIDKNIVINYDIIEKIFKSEELNPILILISSIK